MFQLKSFMRGWAWRCSNTTFHQSASNQASICHRCLWQCTRRGWWHQQCVGNMLRNWMGENKWGDQGKARSSTVLEWCGWVGLVSRFEVGMWLPGVWLGLVGGQCPHQLWNGTRCASGNLRWCFILKWHHAVWLLEQGPDHGRHYCGCQGCQVIGLWLWVNAFKMWEELWVWEGK